MERDTSNMYQICFGSVRFALRPAIHKYAKYAIPFLLTGLCMPLPGGYADVMRHIGNLSDAPCPQFPTSSVDVSVCNCVTVDGNYGVLFDNGVELGAQGRDGFECFG